VVDKLSACGYGSEHIPVVTSHCPLWDDSEEEEYPG
jgi:hypothetical protein